MCPEEISRYFQKNVFEPTAGIFMPQKAAYPLQFQEEFLAPCKAKLDSLGSGRVNFLRDYPASMGRDREFPDGIGRRDRGVVVTGRFVD